MNNRSNNSSASSQEPQENSLFIYKKMTVLEADQILLKRVTELMAKEGKDAFADGYRAWLIRESKITGCLTIQSIVYDKLNDKWILRTDCNAKENHDWYNTLYIRENHDTANTKTIFSITYQRFLLSNTSGWINNNHALDSPDYKQLNAQHGGMKQQITAESGGEYVNDLIVKLNEAGYAVEKRINPYDIEQTKVSGYSRYRKNEPNDPTPLNAFDTTQSRHEFILPTNLARALICPTNTQASSDITAALMKNPVVEVSSGISYERDNLINLYAANQKPCQEGVDFYPNIVLKNIIGYLATTNASREFYLSSLNKIHQMELLDIMSFDVIHSPVITPSGFSYEKNTLFQYINGKSMLFPSAHDPKVPNIIITSTNCIDNKNLALFLKEWPEFYYSVKEAVTNNIAPTPSKN